MSPTEFKFQIGDEVCLKVSPELLEVLDRCCPQPRGQVNFAPVNLYLVRVRGKNVWRKESELVKA